MYQRSTLNSPATACYLLGPSSATMSKPPARQCLLLTPPPRTRNNVRVWGTWSRLYFYLFG